MKKNELKIKIKNHPITRSTNSSSYVREKRRWDMSEEKNDYLSISHYLSYLLKQDIYIVMNTYFGTINKALIDCGNTVISTDMTEKYYEFLSRDVQSTFKIIDIFSSVLYLGKADVVILFSKKIPYFNQFISFIKSHSPKYIVLYTCEDCITLLKDIEFELSMDFLQILKDNLSSKLKILDLNRFFIFKNNKGEHHVL